MSHFKIYYSDTVLSGDGQQDWINAPDQDVQVVVVMEHRPEPPNLPDRFATGFVYTLRTDRIFYTGVDEYDPLGYGSTKFGSLLSDQAYFTIWEEAYADMGR